MRDWPRSARSPIPEAERVTDLLAKRDHERSTTADHHQGFLFPSPRSPIFLCSKLQVFRKYSHALGPDALEFLEDVLDKHEILDEDVESSIDLIAKEYNKQDGKLESSNACALRFDLAISRRGHEGVSRCSAKGVPAPTRVIHLCKLDRARYP